MTEFALEPWREDHAVSLAQYADNEKIEANLRDGFPNPYTVEDALAFIRGCMADEGKHSVNRAIVADGEAVGSIGVFFKDNIYCKSAELGYWLGEPYWGRGIVSRAARQLGDLVFAEYDIVRIYAEPFAHNAGSRRVLEKAGFTLEGILRASVFKRGEIVDSCIYARLVTD